MPHVIQQQHLFVEFQGSEPDAVALQKRLQHFCSDLLLPAIEVTLDRHCQDGRHIRLERLELDIGQLPLERLEYDLAGSVSHALERSLREELSRPGKATVKKTGEEALTDAFLYFLETGSLPWAIRLPAGKDLEQTLLDCWRQNHPTHAPGALQRAAPGLLASSSVRLRLVLQFSDEFLKTMLAMHSAEGAETVGLVLGRLQRLAASAETLEKLRERVWGAAFETVAAGGAISELALLTRAWSRLAVSQSQYHELVWGMELLWPGVTGRAGKDGGPLPEPAPDAGKEPPVAPGEADLSDYRCRQTAYSEARVGIYIDNAGLVLLHPFLPRMFESLQVTCEDNMQQPERALCLLHFLATGSLTAPEYRVTLPKILCNVDLQEPVPAQASLSPAEQEECLALLKAVIGHWGALGDSSADALRGTFLLRPGKLTLREDGDWLLQVESSGCDILLDQLPWGISTIRLPWMDRILWVEWA